jgi:hypothetical protein
MIFNIFFVNYIYSNDNKNIKKATTFNQKNKFFNQQNKSNQKKNKIKSQNLSLKAEEIELLENQEVVENKEVINQSFSNLEEYLESISGEEGEIEILLDKIDFFANNPLNLLNSTPNQIAEIPGISYFDAFSIYEIVQKDSNITIEKLSNLLNFNEFQQFTFQKCAIINKIENQEKIKKNKFSGKIRERSSYQIETPVGYENEKYVGEKWNLYQRFQANSEINFADFDTWNFAAGGLINKNSGELNLAEYSAGYFSFHNQNVKLIFGDFSVKAGMGNVFGDLFTQGKGINVISPTTKFNNQISPFLSKMDFLRMRGVAARFNFPLFFLKNPAKNRISSSIWFSNSPRSATIRIDENTKAEYISSIFTTGIYRTETDIAKKNAIYEKNFGATLEFSGCNYNIGGLLAYFDFEKEIRSTSSRVFAGKNGLMSSLFGTFYFDKVTLSSEISLDNNQKIGVKIGSNYKSKTFDIAFHFRSFDENFRSPYGSIFGEFSYPANELGLYSGLIWKPNSQFKLSSFFDLFYSYTKTYTIDTNVTGFEIFSQFDYKIDKNTSTFFRINYKNKTAQKVANKTTNFYHNDKLNLRLEGEHFFNKSVKIRSRFDFIYLNNKNVVADEFGFSAFAEGNLKLANWLNFQTRISYFSTESYSSAIWQFEYYYPGYSYSPALYDDGMRSFFALHFSFLQRFDIFLRYVNMFKFDAESLGSSYEQIDGNQQNRIYLQIDVKI